MTSPLRTFFTVRVPFAQNPLLNSITALFNSSWSVATSMALATRTHGVDFRGQLEHLQEGHDGLFEGLVPQLCGLSPLHPIFSNSDHVDSLPTPRMLICSLLLGPAALALPCKP